MLDSEIERRIEEKIMRRLKKQEENRIAQAIEQRMREEKASWRDDEMIRIIMEMREQFQKDGVMTTEFVSQFVKKNGHVLENQSSTDMLMSIQAASEGESGNPQAEGKEASVAPGERGRGASQASSWNNACREFEALRVVVWKHSFLPRMQFGRHPSTGIWNAITEIDGDESFSHIAEGDALMSVNGRSVDESVQTEQDLADLLAGFASPLILKFDAADPFNGKVHDYTVTWSNGPLGVTLKDDCSSQKVPIVNRLTKKTGSVAVKHNIAIGDILVAINNIDTIQLGCSLSMSILKKVQLPATLRFRGVGGPMGGGSGSLDDEADGTHLGLEVAVERPAHYVVNWGEGPLGLTIIPGMEEDDLPVIKKVTGTGTSAGIENAQVGDVLETMNDISTTGMLFEDVVAYLKSAPKPVMLKFRPVMEEEEQALPPPPAPVVEVPRPPSKVESRRSSPAPSPPKSMTAPPPAPSPAPSQIVRDEIRDNYKVIWGDGPLGLTIDARDDQPTGAFIKRIATSGAASKLSHDCVGDDLTHINDMDVSRVVFQDIVGQLKAVPRPVTLFFRRRVSEKRINHSASAINGVSTAGAAHHHQQRLSDTPVRGRKPSAHEEAGIHYYNVVWQEGTPLGLSLRGADNTSDYPYITRVTGNGSAAHLPDSVMNDCLVSVDGRSVHVRDKTFDEVMTMLKNMPKPVTLKFQARTTDQSRGGSSSSGPMDPRHHQQMGPPPPGPPQQQFSQTWRQNRGGIPMGGPPTSSSLPTPGGVFASSLVRQNSNLSRSFVTTGGDAGPGNEDKFANLQSPFLVQNKLSTGRRQKMLKGLKK